MAGYREFQTGEVLTAANVNSFLMNQSVMVFADSAARDTALGTAIAGGNALVEGMLTYNVDASALQVYDGTEWTGVAPVAKEKRIARFTGSGTWTAPTGVTYAIAHCLGGGGGAGAGTSGGDGGFSRVSLPGLTVTSNGGRRVITSTSSGVRTGRGALANTGRGAAMARTDGIDNTTSAVAGDSTYIVGGATVNPGTGYSVTVGNGGSAGASGAAGGSGYVYIEYYE